MIYDKYNIFYDIIVRSFKKRPQPSVHILLSLNNGQMIPGPLQ